MHKITLAQEIDLGNLFGKMPAGEWIVQDQTAFEIGVIAKRGDCKVSAFEPSEGLRTGKILIMRSGAFGDLLFATPAFKAFKEANPGKKIYLSCGPLRVPMFDGTDLFDGIEQYPLPADKALDYERIISLESVMENERDLHATDAFAKALGVTVTDYKPIYALSREEAIAAIPKVVHDRPKVGIQMRASTNNRDYPPGRWMQVMAELVKRGWTVYIFGTKNQIWDFPPPQFRDERIINLAHQELSFRESAAILAQMDAFVGVDSVWLHMCHVFDIPAIGLFGPFPWKLRTSKAPKTQALAGIGECGPCFHHVHAGSHFPSGKPCSQIRRCVVMEQIAPDRIIAKVDALKPARV